MPQAKQGKICLIYLIHGDNLKDLLLNSLLSIEKIGANFDLIIYASPSSLAWVENISLQFSSTISPKILLVEIPESTTDKNYSNFGSTYFRAITAKKWALILRTLDLGYSTVIFSDCDIYYLRDFSNYLDAATSIYPCGIQSESQSRFPPEYCTGFMFFRQSCKDMLIQLKKLNESNVGHGDQKVFNNFIKLHPNLVKEILTLPESLFQNGLQYGLHKSPKFSKSVDQLKPYLFHANFVIGVESKVKLLKYSSLWLVNRRNKLGFFSKIFGKLRN